MSTRTDYGEDEWMLLLRAPAMAGIRVVTASPSGPIGVFKELQAMGRWILAAGDDARPGGLVAALVEDVRAIAEKRRTPPAVETRIPADQFHAKLMETLRDVSTLLLAKATPVEAEEYRQWVLGVGAKVAQAAKEGTTFGFGGTLVSDDERAVLREIATALGTTAPAL